MSGASAILAHRFVSGRQRAHGRRKHAVAAAVLSLGLSAAGVPLGGCDWLGEAPEVRARDFIETAVNTPQDDERLRALARAPDAEKLRALLSPTDVELTFEYLRARQRQGVQLQFDPGRVERPDKNRRNVQVSVYEIPTGAYGDREREPAARFVVEFGRTGDNRWRMVQLHSLK